MPLSVRVEDRTPLPGVVVTVAGVPAGTDWTVRGRTPGPWDEPWEWVAARGPSHGRPVSFVDVRAPLDAPATYHLDVDASSAGPVTRPAPATSAPTFVDYLTTADGKLAVEYIRDPEDGRTFTPRVMPFEVPDRELAPVALAPVAGAAEHGLLVRAEGLALRDMPKIGRLNAQVVVLHNAARCWLHECDIPPSELAVITDAPAPLTPRLERAQRDYSLKLLPVESAWGEYTSAATWGDVDRRWRSVADLRASGLSVAGLAAGGWG